MEVDSIFFVKSFSSSADIYFRFKYIVVLDIDEVIVPQKHGSWSAMMEEVLKAKRPETISWHFRHTYFIDSMTEEEVESKIERDESESNNVKSSKPSLQLCRLLGFCSKPSGICCSRY